MQVLGLTGDIACGKSTVAKILSERGAHAIDADLLVRELYSDPAFARAVVELFADRFEGNSATSVSSLTHHDGTINRVALGDLVFSDQRALRQLEALVHPAVARLREEKLQALRSSEAPPSVVVLEAVKLIESGQARGCDVVWCVTCHPDIQTRRLMEKRGLSAAAARARVSAQPGLEAKRGAVGEVPFVEIENNGTLDDLTGRIETELAKIVAR
ncbi:MAG: dephospho-CoA kinase [Abditibacteriota bacterium]|nr:dephospho-CoA kinase [Abditibacteriota bacterium]